MSTEDPMVRSNEIENKEEQEKTPESAKASIFIIIENTLAFILLLLVALIPILETLLRYFFSTGIPDVHVYLEHLVLWICFVGAMITSREGRHLSLSVGVERIEEPVKGWVVSFTGFLSIAFTVTLCLASFSFAMIGFGESQKVGIFPISLISLIMPVGFAILALRFGIRLEPGLKRWLGAVLGVLLGLLLGVAPLFSGLTATVERLLPILPLTEEGGLALVNGLDTVGFAVTQTVTPLLNAVSLPLLILLLVSAFLGAPIFIVLGGAATLFFIRSAGSLEIMPNEAYTMLTGEIIPAIPLFTMAGFILSESRAGERLIKLFRALFGWFPGGLAVMSILVCAFFTTFTGGSGVTILALGGLLSYVLLERGFKEDFTTGLLTGSGSIGLLFPPSLPIIMYGVVAQVNIKELFVGGLLPGVLMVLTLAILGVRRAMVIKVERIRFQAKEIWPTLKESMWEILLPIIILASYFSGFTTLVETASLAVIYVLIVQLIIYRDIKLKDLPKVLTKSLPIIGGVLIILAVAKGLSYYLVDAQIPTLLTEWSSQHIHSKYVFLILLNLSLLVTGCLMDIFSAITVVAPLIIPLGVAYGIHPVHLGIIFLANLELGYLTPPVGINLFLASYRFDQPLSRIYRNIVPFLIALLVAVLFITYVPPITTALLDIIKF
jgi:C4-dicarboxylate transporter DctM subunit